MIEIKTTSDYIFDKLNEDFSSDMILLFKAIREDFEKAIESKNNMNEDDIKGIINNILNG